MQDRYIQNTVVQVPGLAVAQYQASTTRNGVIARLVFIPSASDAGYSGPAAAVFEGDLDLDVETTDGPFWRAMQERLAQHPQILWEE